MSSVKREFIFSVFYTAVTKYSSIFLQLFITGVLSRLLSPDEFGVVAMAMVLIIFFSLLGDLGIAPAIIHNKNLTKEDINSIFSFSCIIGLVLTAIFFSSAHYIAAFYKKDILYNICCILSIHIFFNTANIVPNSLLQKNKEFRFLMFRQIIIQILSGIIGITFAYLDYGVYALLIYTISSSFMNLVVNYVRNPLKVVYPKKASIKKIINFSAFQFLSNLVIYFGRNLDKILVGKFFSSSSLAFYEKSYRLILLPVENLATVVSPVILPFFSEFQSDLNKIFHNYLKITRILAILSFPLSVLIYFTAKELTLIVFGVQWIPSIPILKILSWTISIQVISAASGAFFQSTGKIKLMFIITLINSFMGIACIFFGIFVLKTLEGLAYCLTLYFCITFFFSHYFLVEKGLENSYPTFLKNFIKPFLLAVVLFICEYTLSLILNEEMNVFLSFGLKTLLAIVVFTLYIWKNGGLNKLNLLFSKT